MTHEEYRTDRYKDAPYHRNDQSKDTAFRDEAGLFWPAHAFSPASLRESVKSKTYDRTH